MGWGRNLTFQIGMMLVLLGTAKADSTVRDWTHEYDELTTESSSFPESLESEPFIGSWDVFISGLPNSNLITWALSWMGTSPYERNSAAPKTMSPASVQKILTATTALRVLGSDFRFSNSFQAHFDSAQKIVSDVEFSVSGDPTWAHSAYGERLSDRMNLVVQELQKQGVKKVVGDVRIAHSQPRLMEYVRPAQWKSSWLFECYATLPSPVILNGNCASFKVTSGTRAAWITAGVSTPLDVRLSKSKKTAIQLTSVLDEYGRVAKYQIRGTFASAMTYSVPVQNNVDWFKNLFIQALTTAGIGYEPKGVASTLEPKTKLFVDLSSKPLREILPPFLEDSINLIADRLYLEVAYRLGSVDLAEPQLRSVVELLRDVNAATDMVALDGSGLLAADQIAAETLRKYLDVLRSQPYFQDFVEALPIAGKTGTLKSRLTGTLTRGRVFAKTGTIDGVANLAGYFLKDDSSYEPFVVFTRSNLAASNVRLQMDKIVTEFARQNASLSTLSQP